MFVRLRPCAVFLATLIALSAGLSRVTADPFDDAAGDRSQRADNLAASGTKMRRITGQTFTPRRVGAEPARGARPVQPFQEGRLVYNNTLGDTAIVPGAGRLIADDISTAAANGCQLVRYSFRVVGKVDPEGPGGPFSVDFALYSQCPFSAPVEGRDALIITGTAGSATFDIDGPHEISLVPAADARASVPNSFWLGVTFSRDNAGIIGGAPPLEGISSDDLAYRSCWDGLGGFPGDPHSSFNAEVVVDTQCQIVHFGYRALTHGLGSPYSPKANVWIVDDLKLEQPACRMTGLEFAVRGIGEYEFELRENCSGSPLPGTAFSLIVGPPEGDRWSLIHKKFDPPVELPQSLWFAARSIGAQASFPVTFYPQLGESNPVLAESEAGTCTPVSVFQYFPETLQVSIQCEGESAIGSCCDIYVKQCAGGPFEDEPCQNDAECPEGLCEIQCRDVAEINCPVREGGYLQPTWVENATCAQAPFPDQSPCGAFLCCYEDDYGPTCSNLSQRDCMDRQPIGNFPGKWQIGRHCGDQHASCPPIGCVRASGSCTEPHSSPGCEVWDCCESICYHDSFCCDVEWDSTCVDYTLEGICEPPPENDSCNGAVLIPVPGAKTTFSLFARIQEAERLCCHNGIPRVCIGGPAYRTCEDDDECWPGVCQNREPLVSPGLWYKFVANSTSIRVSTCQSAQVGSEDSIIGVYAASNSASPEVACSSLDLIACADDTVGCGPDGKLAEVCLNDLTLGRAYFVLLGGKGYEGHEYKISVSSPCTTTSPLSGSCVGDQ